MSTNDAKWVSMWACPISAYNGAAFFENAICQ